MTERMSLARAREFAAPMNRALALRRTAPVHDTPPPLPLCDPQPQVCKDNGPSRIVYDGDGPIYDDEGNLLSEGEGETTT